MRLVPFRSVAVEDVWRAAQGIREWTLSLAPYGKSLGEVGAYVAAALAEEDAGTGLPFAVVLRAEGRVVGSTRLLGIDAAHRKAELGYTWYAPEVWGTGVNPSCKLLLLRHAFEGMGLERVHLFVNALNARSLRAVARLGAVREGVLRRDRRLADGSWRDTVVFSILRAEWPGVEAGLLARLGEGLARGGESG